MVQRSGEHRFYFFNEVLKDWKRIKHVGDFNTNET